MGRIAILARFEYEYEYRDAEYEYEKTHEQSIGPKCSIERVSTCVELSPGIRSMQPICTEVLH